MIRTVQITHLIKYAHLSIWEVLTAVRESGNIKGQRQIKNSGPKQPNWRVDRRLGKLEAENK